MIYSPSSTDTHLRCPLLRRYTSVEGWRLKMLGKRDLAAVLSIGVHAGLATYDIVESASIAVKECAAEIAHLRSHGCDWPASLGRDIDILPIRAGTLTDQVLHSDIIPSFTDVKHTELKLPDHGDCRIDIVLEDEHGPYPLDWKLRSTLSDRYRTSTLASFRRSRQMYHYAWALGEHLGVTIRRYAIGLIVVEPFSVEVLHYTIPDEQMAHWENNSYWHWGEMFMLDHQSHVEDVMPSNWTACEDKFGLCDFHSACWDHFRNRTAMELDYVRVPRRER